jgi:acyl-coenzyme A thioesterase PaaI-like protein
MAAQFDPSDIDSLLEQAVADSTAAQSFKQRSNILLSRRVLTVKEENIADNLSTTLAGPGLLSPQPFVFTDDEAGAMLSFYHVGRRLSGHPKVVHGGLVAVLLDECMGRACFGRLPGKIAVTAKLEISYKSPIPVDSVISIFAETIDVQGRKVRVSATVEDVLSAKILVTASGLFVEPKWAADIFQG